MAHQIVGKRIRSGYGVPLRFYGDSFIGPFRRYYDGTPLVRPDPCPFPRIRISVLSYACSGAWSVLRGRNAATDAQEANQ